MWLRRAEHFVGMGDLAPQFDVFLGDLGQHFLERRPGCGIAIESQAERSVRRIVFQPIQQYGQHARVAYAQASQQKGHVRSLLLTQFLIQFAAGDRRPFRRREAAPGSDVIDVFRRPADGVHEKIDGFGVR